MTTPYRIVIIGAGFSGLCMGIKLKEAGFNDFVILEKGEDVGGVWRANSYPGACCDVPANLYSFSFAMKSDWSRRFPQQPEIQEYMRDCARRYGLYAHMQFNIEVTAASYDEQKAHWNITTSDGNSQQANILMAGTGQLSRPATPNIKGMDTFTGTSFHSAEWNHDYDLSGKRVAVIGAGASAIQFVPAIAGKVSQLYSLQRSAPYVIPKPDESYNPIQHTLFDKFSSWARLYREFWYRVGEVSTSALNGDQRSAALYTRVAQWWRNHHIKDPALRTKLTPNYPIGCNRILFSNNYYPALAQDNVDVVTDGIAEITNSGIQLTNGQHLDVDCIIYGTGFKATEFLAPMSIRGQNGQDLNDAWRDGAEAYLGINVTGFPNLFMLYGPNTNLGSNSIIFMIECQARYIMDCLQQMRAGQLQAVDVDATVMQQFNTGLQEQLKDSAWAGGCSSWYATSSGKITNNWPGFTQDYKRLTQQCRLSDYHTQARENLEEKAA